MAILQQTIQKNVSVEGVGLHCGDRVRVTFKPAPAGHGIQFVRTDLPGHLRVKADISSVMDLEKRPRRTSIGEGAVEIQTVEHLMASLAALEIDNLLVEIDRVELPGLDGSALGFIEALQKAGREVQDQPRRVFRIREPIWVEENGTSLLGLPYDGFRISYTLSYDHPLLRAQYYDIVLNGNNFEKEVAPSRTFCLKREAEQLKRLGMGRGATYDNTLVIGDEGVIQNRFRFDDECARHKVLDLIGDLYLMGAIRGHILAHRSGHPLNITFLRKLKEQEERLSWGGVQAKEQLPGAAQMNLEQIKRIIPHRDPFLFVDEILSLEEDTRAIGVKRLKAEDYFFKGHFPNHPILPGVLIVEALAQVAGLLILNRKENLGKYAYFMGMDKVKFRKPVLPGDELILEVEMVRVKARAGHARGQALVNGKVVAEADMMTFAVVDG